MSHRIPPQPRAAERLASLEAERELHVNAAFANGTSLRLAN